LGEKPCISQQNGPANNEYQIRERNKVANSKEGQNNKVWNQTKQFNEFMNKLINLSQNIFSTVRKMPLGSIHERAVRGSSILNLREIIQLSWTPHFYAKS
jgi:hypothetical protein